MNEVVMICRVGNVLKRCNGDTVRTATLPVEVTLNLIATQDALKVARDSGAITLERWTDAVIQLKETVFAAHEDKAPFGWTHVEGGASA